MPSEIVIHVARRGAHGAPTRELDAQPRLITYGSGVTQSLWLPGKVATRRTGKEPLRQPSMRECRCPYTVVQRAPAGGLGLRAILINLLGSAYNFLI